MTFQWYSEERNSSVSFIVGGSATDFLTYKDAYALEKTNLSIGLKWERYPTMLAESHESPAPVRVFASTWKADANSMAFPSDHAVKPSMQINTYCGS